MASTAEGVFSPQADDSFELYDLRVEVVCPAGERIMCGAKEGDYFTLEGEMLYLPPGQGISIYSLGEWHDMGGGNRTGTSVTTISADEQVSICPSAPGSEAARDARQRLDDLGCAHRLPGSQLQIPAKDSADGEEEVQPC